MQQRQWHLGTIVAVLLAGATPAGPARAQLPDRPIYDTVADTYLTVEQLGERLGEADVVYVGETHTDFAHHLVQLEVLRMMRAGNEAVAMGWEMFHSSQQPLLDAYSQGWLSETEWLDAIYWKETWGYPYPYYKPLLDYARENRIRIFGLNAPREVVRRVRLDGRENLAEDIAWWLPAGFWDRITIEEEARYKAWFMEVARHDSTATDESMEAMFASQTAWNEVMGWNVAKAFNVIPDPNLQVLVIVGSGHAIFKQGVPTRAERFMPGLRQVVIMPQTTDRVMSRDEIREQELEKEGDYLWFVEPAADPPGTEAAKPPPPPATPSPASNPDPPPAGNPAQGGLEAEQ